MLVLLVLWLQIVLSTELIDITQGSECIEGICRDCVVMFFRSRYYIRVFVSSVGLHDYSNLTFGILRLCGSG